jgi:hypothetical protein
MAKWETIQDAGRDLFFAVVEKEPLCEDDQGFWCYWCGTTAYPEENIQHKDDCMWVRVRDFFQDRPEVAKAIKTNTGVCCFCGKAGATHASFDIGGWYHLGCAGENA